jgi:hypothetical protein
MESPTLLSGGTNRPVLIKRNYELTLGFDTKLNTNLKKKASTRDFALCYSRGNVSKHQRSSRRRA